MFLRKCVHFIGKRKIGGSVGRKIFGLHYYIFLSERRVIVLVSGYLPFLFETVYSQSHVFIHLQHADNVGIKSMKWKCPSLRMRIPFIRERKLPETLIPNHENHYYTFSRRISYICTMVMPVTCDLVKGYLLFLIETILASWLLIVVK